MDTTRRNNLAVDYDYETGQWSAFDRRAIESLEEAAAHLFRRAAARRSFPNYLGNYRGKRTPRPAGKPLEPRERFSRLQAHFLSHRMTYRNPPTKHDVRFDAYTAALAAEYQRLQEDAARWRLAFLAACLAEPDNEIEEHENE